MTEAAVEAAGIHKRFGSTRALRGVDLRLEPGRCLGGYILINIKIWKKKL